MENGKRRSCAVITRFGRELTDEGYKACTRMIGNSYPEQNNGEGILFFTGAELNSMENMVKLMETNPGMYLVLSMEDGLRLLPSGEGNMEGYVSVFEEAIKEKTFNTSWELLDAFLKEMERYKPSAG